MSTHNICFDGEIRKISILFGLKKRILSRVFSFGTLLVAVMLCQLFFFLFIYNYSAILIFFFIFFFIFYNFFCMMHCNIKFIHTIIFFSCTCSSMLYLITA